MTTGGLPGLSWAVRCHIAASGELESHTFRYDPFSKRAQSLTGSLALHDCSLDRAGLEPATFSSVAWIRRCPSFGPPSVAKQSSRKRRESNPHGCYPWLFSKQVPPPIGWLFQNVPCGVIKFTSVMRTKKKPRLSVRGCHGETRSSSPQTAQRLGSNCSTRSAWSTLLMSCCT